LVEDAGGGGSTVRGELQIRRVPFLAQPDYDRLLWASDINFVRGEDSLVRALWAARPVVWQLYPQDGRTHCAKLEPFLARYRAPAALPEPNLPGTDRALDALATLHRCWNGCPDGSSAPSALRSHVHGDTPEATGIARAWADVESALAPLTAHAQHLSDAWAALPDLTERLARFCREKLK
ncbi:MAG: elongation factor P maturation arginine rhamnosyltransferase EarP, partial [Proteobacteria bacterium]|nr:elongation factor P maturation arginine rhamnosyltransferase EarP [Burkholderiales bacterium]